MPKPINLKTKALYMGVYDPEDESALQWVHFIYSSSASDKELDKHFKEIVYKSEYGVKLKKEDRVDVYEIQLLIEYLKNGKIRQCRPTFQ